MVSVLATVLACLLVATVAADDGCVPYTAEYGIVCVCNSTYCDTAGNIRNLTAGEYALITTSEGGQRFNITYNTTTLSHIPHDVVDEILPSVVTAFKTFPKLSYISVDPRITYQEMEGFGGSFTDAAGLNILNISSEAQDNLLKSLYGSDGLRYNVGRLPMAGTDYSTYPYSYNEYPVNDTNLSNFTLSSEDFTLKIPLIKRAQELASDEIRLFATSWSPPVWMKTNNALYGQGHLKREYYYSYALYNLKFLQEYEKENISIYAITPGNEPTMGALTDIVTGNSCGWVTRELANWVMNYFGPMLRESEFSDIKIYVLDDQTPYIDTVLPIFLENEEILKYIDGVGVHWYLDDVGRIADIDKIYDLLGNISIFNTEASQGVLPADLGIKLGDWTRAETYLANMITKMHHNVSGWIDWNLAVNMEGGPSWVDESLDSFIVVDANNDQFYKTPMYYAFGHMSKYLPRGSKRIASKSINDIPNAAFVTPEGLVTIVALNNGTTDHTLSIDDISTGQFIKFTLEANSIATIIYSPENLLESPSE